MFLNLLTLWVCAAAHAQASTLHLQVTSISQEHGAFPSAYSGPNSLTSGVDRQTSLTLTVFAGWKLWSGGELYANPEIEGGSGFSHTTGVAGFPNGEIYRVDNPSPKWTLARFYLKQTFPLGGTSEEVKDGNNQIATTVSARRVTIALGRIALPDYFDNNTYSHDPRTQFLNWSLMDNGAWDYAADTRGYTWGAYAEYVESRWSLRAASVLESKRANQLEMQANFPQYRGDNLELERRFQCHDQPGALRLLVYRNTTDGGNYRRALAEADARGTAPDIVSVRSKSTKTGVGLNLEQALNADWGTFARLGWSDGRNETWSFTEIDHTLSFGATLKGRRWHRPADGVGMALIANGLSGQHRDYLAAGGNGFILGDGKLNYDLEQIGELYYLYQLAPGLQITGDYQFVRNPGYNADRGPVSIFAIRLHGEI